MSYSPEHCNHINKSCRACLEHFQIVFMPDNNGKFAKCIDCKSGKTNYKEDKQDNKEDNKQIENCKKCMGTGFVLKDAPKEYLYTFYSIVKKTDEYEVYGVLCQIKTKDTIVKKIVRIKNELV